MKTRSSILILALFWSLACSSSTPAITDAGDTPPSVEMTDSSDVPAPDVPVADVGPDDFVPVDTKTTDTSDVSAEDGTDADATVSTDQQTQPDPDEELLAFLTAWFDDYNEGQTLAYLDEEITIEPNGDARYPNAPQHTYLSNVRYGPFGRNVLDLWQIASDQPTPLVVYIHGGGFKAGGKDDLHNQPSTIPRFLSDGISVASISYRYAYKNAELVPDNPIPNGPGDTNLENSTRLDYVLRDCARSIQFLRYKAADWNLDKDRIAAFGGSAGAGCVMWTATVPDLAQAEHADPVLRESTRLVAAGHTNGQVTYNWARWPELLNMSPDFVFDLVGGEAVRLTQMSLDDAIQTQEGQDLGKVLDYYAHLSAGDMAFYSKNAGDAPTEEDGMTQGELVHHPQNHVVLYERCVELGMNCEIKTQILSSEFPGDVVDFMIFAVTTMTP